MYKPQLPTTPVRAKIIRANRKTATVKLPCGRELTIRKLCCMRVVKKRQGPWLSNIPFRVTRFPSNKQIVLAKIRVTKHRRRVCWAPHKVWQMKNSRKGK